MISSDDQSGVFTFLVGIIVLVLAGVALSLLVDKRFRFSSDKAAIETAVRADAGELADLQTMLGGVQARFETEGPSRDRASGRYAEARARIRELDSRMAELQTARTAAEREIAAVGQAFANYREDYRKSEWSRAEGESLGTLTVRGGKEYHQAVISRVTDAGLEIRHEHGIARVQAPDLDLSLRERFQWDDARRARLLADEREHQVAMAKEAAAEQATPNEARPTEQRIPKSIPPASADAEAVTKARAEVQQWQARVIQLKSDHRSALSSSSLGGTSVPGSLETWPARAARLGRELARARAALAVARDKLSRLAPGDPLTRLQPDEY